jgi:hypothetical protein
MMYFRPLCMTSRGLPVKKAIKILVKSPLCLLAGIVFLAHALQGEGDALHVLLQSGVENLFLFHNMGLKSVGNFAPKPRQMFRRLAAVSRQT